MAIIKYLSDSLSIDILEISKFISTSPYRYKTYLIPKRNNTGMRTIAQPSKELKLIQRSVADAFLKTLPIHDCATAYRKKLNIRDNTAIHSGRKYLLKMDFENFFPSIKPSDLIQHIKRHSIMKVDSSDYTAITNIFFYKNKNLGEYQLSIGAPTSPLISNSIMFNFDTIVNNFCLKKGINYSRYADDIAFSTDNKNILFDVPNYIKKLLLKIKYPKIRINEDKTVFLSRKGNMHLTGLVLTVQGNVSIGREKKRQIKTLIFKHLQKQLDQDELSYLSGFLAYCYGVEPTFIMSLKTKYGEKIVNELMNK